MQLDAGIASAFAAATARADEPLWTMSPVEARAAAAREILRIGGQPEPMASVEELSIPGPAGPIEATLYRPAGREEHAPLLTFIHGGGWVIGSRETHDRICRAIARLADTAILSIDYRLAPEHPFPAPLDDCWAAMQWVVESAAGLGFDSARVAVGGDSAGANLAAVVARRARDERVPLACQYLLYPVTSAALASDSYAQFATGYGLTRQDMEWFWAQYIPDHVDAGHPDASPLALADPSNLAPAVLVTAELDVLRDEGEEYANRLADAGVPTLRWRAPGMPHAFLNYRGVSAGVEAAYSVCARLLRQSLAS